jgi:hypothetical protein
MAVASPGASARGYFDRGFLATDGAGKFYNRPRSSFQNNGR